MIIEKIYAEGFLEHSKESIGITKALDDLRDVKGVFRDSPGLKDLLENPAITYSEKCGVIDNVLGPEFSKEICSFLKLLLKKSRIDKFPAIAEYVRIKYAHGDEEDAVLKASYPLDTNTIESIKSVMERKLKRKLHLYMDLDPSLLGGARLEFGNKVIDGSVKKRLEDLKEKLMAVKV